MKGLEEFKQILLDFRQREQWEQLFFYNSFRNLATGIFICSRYLATVRRAIL
jgi:hypothetical protein